MMFYFINSYDKSQRFRCGIGAIINANDAMFAGDSQTFNKIHKGTALDDALRNDLDFKKFESKKLLENETKIKIKELTIRMNQLSEEFQKISYESETLEEENKSIEEVKSISDKIIGMNLVTPQTPPEGKKVNLVLIAEDVYYPGESEPEEFYVSILLNRVTGKNMIMYSTEGGMDIESVAENTPELIFYEDLWADDLSSYDVIAELPFSIPFYGDHVSLLPILASIVRFFTKEI